MLARYLAPAALLAFALPVPAAPPRDAALRLAPDDFALTVVVHDLGARAADVADSPFAAWLPTTALGKQLLGSDGAKQLSAAGGPMFDALGVTPADLLRDVLGDAVVFAYTPGPAGGPTGERSVTLIRPGKPAVLADVIRRLNDAQINKSKELKEVVEHRHAGAPYFERRRAGGGSDFYCFRGDVFAFSQSAEEIKAVIARDQRPAADAPPALAARVAKLGVADATVAVLLNPRPLDAALAAKVKAAGPGERAFLTKFAEVWAATDSAALYLALDAGAELGAAVRFEADKLPAAARAWLADARRPSALWAAVPADAMFALAGRGTPTDLFALLDAVHPADGRPGLRQTVELVLGSAVGQAELPLVLDALGPDWAVWLAPPPAGAVVPVGVGAVRFRADGDKGAEASKALAEALGFGFQSARFVYNSGHKDQLKLREEKDGAAVITALAGDALPAGVRPCFALKGGYLLLATSPDAIRGFRAPPEPRAGGDFPAARFGATSTRAYLTGNAPQLAKLLAGAGEERALAEQFGTLAALLEPLDKVELFSSADATGVKVMLRAKTTRSLKK